MKNVYFVFFVLAIFFVSGCVMPPSVMSTTSPRGLYPAGYYPSTQYRYGAGGYEVHDTTKFLNQVLEPELFPNLDGCVGSAEITAEGTERHHGHEGVATQRCAPTPLEGRGMRPIRGGVR